MEIQPILSFTSPCPSRISKPQFRGMPVVAVPSAAFQDIFDILASQGCLPANDVSRSSPSRSAIRGHPKPGTEPSCDSSLFRNLSARNLWSQLGFRRHSGPGFRCGLRKACLSRARYAKCLVHAPADYRTNRKSKHKGCFVLVGRGSTTAKYIGGGHKNCPEEKTVKENQRGSSAGKGKSKRHRIYEQQKSSTL